MRLVDSHSHLFLEEFDEDLPQVVERARQAGVSHIFMPNIDSTTIAPLLRVCEEYPGYCFPMIGLHPTSVNDNYEAELSVVKQQLLSNEHYVAVGEIGMDLYWDKTYEKQQRKALDVQLSLALEHDLPVVIHCREAFEEIFQVLEPYKNTHLRGIWHCFTGTKEEARRALAFSNFLLGINGVVTFKKSALPEVLRDIPLDRMVLETDAPYLAPVPHRGQRNETAFVKDTLLKLADILGEQPEYVAKTTSANALRMFGQESYLHPNSLKYIKKTAIDR